MADFAITFWVWEQTGSATALALTGVFFQLPRLVTALFAGILVDRVSRKGLMMLSEAVAAVSVLWLLWLHVNGQLAIGHLYAAACVNGGFEKFGQLAYRASITLLVQPQHYTRASSMTTAIDYGANIVAPALAGLLYSAIGLEGIFSINVATFAVAIATIALLQIPQPAPADQPLRRVSFEIATLWKEVSFGARYLWNSRQLRSLLATTALFGAFLALSETIYDPMILARTGGSSEVLGMVSAIAGFGGIVGAIAVSVWGGFQKSTRGMLLGYISVGIVKTIFALGQGVGIWLPTQFWSSMNFPLIWGSEAAFWMVATPAAVQGRVFAVSFLMDDLLSVPIGLMAGVLSDRVLEPAMQSSGWMQAVFGPMVGTGEGAGMALLFAGSAIGMMLVGVLSFKVTHLRELEKV